MIILCNAYAKTMNKSAKNRSLNLKALKIEGEVGCSIWHKYVKSVRECQIMEEKGRTLIHKCIDFIALNRLLVRNRPRIKESNLIQNSIADTILYQRYDVSEVCAQW